MTRRKTEKEKPPVGIDLGMGLDELLRGMGNLVDVVNGLGEMGTASELGQGTGMTCREVRDLAGIKGSRAIFGYSVNMGAGGRPRVEHFGNVYKKKDGVAVEETREPLVDVFDEEECIRIVAELPGVSEGNITTSVDGSTLRISAEGADRSYSKVLELPVAVKEGSLISKYRNGVLELTIKKAKASSSKKGPPKKRGR